jgi:hypothetical protein
MLHDCIHLQILCHNFKPKPTKNRQNLSIRRICATLYVSLKSAKPLETVQEHRNSSTIQKTLNSINYFNSLLTMTSKKVTPRTPTIAGKMMGNRHFQPGANNKYHALQNPETQPHGEFYMGTALAFPNLTQTLISCHFSQFKQPMIASNMTITNPAPGTKMTFFGPPPKPRGYQPPPKSSTMEEAAANLLTDPPNLKRGTDARSPSNADRVNTTASPAKKLQKQHDAKVMDAKAPSWTDSSIAKIKGFASSVLGSSHGSDDDDHVFNEEERDKALFTNRKEEENKESKDDNDDDDYEDVFEYTEDNLELEEDLKEFVDQYFDYYRNETTTFGDLYKAISNASDGARLSKETKQFVYDYASMTYVYTRKPEENRDDDKDINSMDEVEFVCVVKPANHANNNNPFEPLSTSSDEDYGEFDIDLDKNGVKRTKTKKSKTQAKRDRKAMKSAPKQTSTKGKPKPKKLALIFMMKPKTPVKATSDKNDMDIDEENQAPMVKKKNQYYSKSYELRRED